MEVFNLNNLLQRLHNSYCMIWKARLFVFQLTVMTLILKAHFQLFIYERKTSSGTEEVRGLGPMGPQ